MNETLLENHFEVFFCHICEERVSKKRLLVQLSVPGTTSNSGIDAFRSNSDLAKAQQEIKGVVETMIMECMPYLSS
jgi:hypothetical protein